MSAVASIMILNCVLVLKFKIGRKCRKIFLLFAINVLENSSNLEIQFALNINQTLLKLSSEIILM